MNFAVKIDDVRSSEYEPNVDQRLIRIRFFLAAYSREKVLNKFNFTFAVRLHYIYSAVTNNTLIRLNIAHARLELTRCGITVRDLQYRDRDHRSPLVKQPQIAIVAIRDRDARLRGKISARGVFTASGMLTWEHARTHARRICDCTFRSQLTDRRIARIEKINDTRAGAAHAAIKTLIIAASEIGGYNS